MDPNKAQELKAELDELHLRMLNLLALGHFIKCLKACGVREPKVFNAYFHMEV